LQADFDNYKKHFETEKINIIKTANENLMKELIMILDDLDNALKIVDEKNHEGVKLIYDKLFNLLSKFGLKPVNTNCRFNPEMHEAVLSEEGEDDGLILEELQKGYELNSKIIRYPKVKVSKRGD